MDSGAAVLLFEGGETIEMLSGTFINIRLISGTGSNGQIQVNKRFGSQFLTLRMYNGRSPPSPTRKIEDEHDRKLQG
jgi:hypothetical protein